MNIDYPTNNVEQLKFLWKEAFGDGDEFLDMFFEKVYSPQKCRAVYEDGQTASALYWFDAEYQNKKLAYIYAVATLKKFRGKGICQALMTDTHKLLKESGYDGALLVPGSESLFEFYGKMGYETTCRINKFTAFASYEKVEIQKISKEEFAHLRKMYLPAGGVIQENENITFLSELYGLYAGEGFVMAANVKDGIMHCAEFLGNEKLCPKVLKSLGCSKGYFRTPNGSIPFAMYLPFNRENICHPNYFGLAFD